MTATSLFLAQGLDAVAWSERHARGEVPDRWPYGLNRLPGVVEPVEVLAGTGLIARGLRRFAGPYDWSARNAAPRDGVALCWDERTGIPVALGRRRGPTASGVIWLSDTPPTGGAARVARRALSRCDAVWALSAAQLEPLARDWGVPTARLHHVLFGVDTAFWAPGADADAQTPSGSVVSVGNDRDRDHGLMLAAAAIVQRQQPAARLALFTRRAVEVPAELGVRVPDIAHAQLREHYRGAAVVALAMRPNLHCSGMTAALEAMSCGVPVVVSDTPGMSDYVEHGVTGMLVRPDDPDAMAAAIGELLADPAAARELGAAARRAASDRFDTAHLAAALNRLRAGVA